MGTLKQPPATYGKGDRRQGVGTVWSIHQADDGWWDMVHKLNDGYFIFSALADSPEAVERTFLAIEFTLSAGGFLGDGGEDPQMS